MRGVGLGLAPSRWYIVGTPNSIVAPSRRRAAAAAASKRPRWRSSPPRRSGPSIPSTRPWTWKSGRPWMSTSSAVHSQASASASRLEAIARRGRIAPFGGPVVPDV